MSRESKATITISGEVVVVITPHTEAFPEQARKLHGRWNGHAWVFKASQLDQVEALCLQFFAAVEFEQAPAYAMPEPDPEETDAGGREVTIPGLTEEEDGGEDITAVTQVKSAGSASDSESAPVRMVIREVADQAAQRADIERRERATIEAEIDKLTKRLRFLLDRLSELDEGDD